MYILRSTFLTLQDSVVVITYSISVAIISTIQKAEGWKFPPVREAEAMYEADIAPNWEEGEVCHRYYQAMYLSF